MQDQRNNANRVGDLESGGCLGSFENCTSLDSLTSHCLDPTVALACA
jgi:hypothetical protein